jgi:hypothetical protein
MHSFQAMQLNQPLSLSALLVYQDETVVKDAKHIYFSPSEKCN